MHFWLPLLFGLKVIAALFLLRVRSIHLKFPFITISVLSLDPAPADTVLRYGLMLIKYKWRF